MSPIRPENRDRYPSDWPGISHAIKERARWRCECHGECGRGTHPHRCPNRHGRPAYGTGSTVFLTTAHLDHTPENCDPSNLKAMCQGLPPALRPRPPRRNQSPHPRRRLGASDGRTNGTPLPDPVKLPHPQHITPNTTDQDEGRTRLVNISAAIGSAADPAIATMRMIDGTGGPVGVTVDGRSAPLGASEWVAYRYGLAPKGLATRRQLAACGLRPGGAQPVAQLSWRHGKSERIAYLYDVAVAVPKRAMTPGKAGALAKAMRARRTCPVCHLEAGYCIPRSLGSCLDCNDLRTTQTDNLRATYAA